MPRFAAALTIALAAGAPAVATADIQDWELSEVVASVGGDPDVRYVELTNPVGGCLFPTSRVDVRDGDGGLIASVPLAAATVCFEAGWYLLLATPEATAHFGVARDGPMPAVLDAPVRQICFASSETNYDCVRWGAPAAPIADFFGAGDSSSAPRPAADAALGRSDRTHVVADDWELMTPTPLGPNDGSPWLPTDAGPLPPDAAPGPDATPPPDAGPIPDAAVIPDARPRADARNTDFLDVDPVGGAACECRTGAGGPPPWWALVFAIAVLARRRNK